MSKFLPYTPHVIGLRRNRVMEKSIANSAIHLHRSEDGKKIKTIENIVAS